jgi:hypothetical protein
MRENKEVADASSFFVKIFGNMDYLSYVCVVKQKEKP